MINYLFDDSTEEEEEEEDNYPFDNFDDDV